MAGILARVDHDESELARVGPFVQIVHRHCVGVVPTRACRSRRKPKLAVAMRRNGRRFLLFHAVNFGWNQKTVPVDKFGRVRVIDNVHSDGLAFAHAEYGAGRSAVVSDGADDAGRGELDRNRPDAQGEVRFGA